MIKNHRNEVKILEILVRYMHVWLYIKEICTVCLLRTQLKRVGMQSCAILMLGILNKHYFLGYICRKNVFDVALPFLMTALMFIDKCFVGTLCLHIGCSSFVFIL